MSKCLINKRGVVLSAKWKLMLSCFQCDLISFGFSGFVSKISTEEMGYGKDKSNKCCVLALYVGRSMLGGECTLGKGDYTVVHHFYC